MVWCSEVSTFLITAMKSGPELTIFIIFRIIPVIFHSLGIYLLLNVKFIKRYQPIQGRYLLWLSCIEICMNLSKIAIKLVGNQIAFYLDTLRTGLLGTQMLLILMTLTGDRAAYVYLRFKYEMQKSHKAINVIIGVVLLISFVLTVVLFFTHQTKSELSETKTLYFWPIMDSFVLLTFIICYIFMVKTIAHRSKRLFGKESERYQTRMTKATLVPKLIVMSFILLWFSVDLLYFAFLLSGEKMEEWLVQVANVLVCAAYSSDAIIYIYWCRPIRRMLFSKLCGTPGRRISETTISELPVRPISCNNNNRISNAENSDNNGAGERSERAVNNTNETSWFVVIETNNTSTKLNWKFYIMEVQCAWTHQ